MMFSLLTALLLAHPVAAAEGTPWASAAQDYVLGPGDVIEVKVLEEPELSGSFPVEDNGTIVFPHIGPVDVRGKTAPQVAERLTAILAEEYLVNPQVFVKMEAYLSQPVSILGQVQKPGEYFLDGPTTLLGMVAQAGGFKDEAVTEVQITRAGESLSVDYTELKKPGGDMQLRGGDQVYVPEGRAVYVEGQAQKPGTVPFREGITLYQAITMAGGLEKTARTNKVYILRDGKRLEVNLRRIMQGKDEDVVLLPEDQIFIDRARI